MRMRSVALTVLLLMLMGTPAAAVDHEDDILDRFLDRVSCTLGAALDPDPSGYFLELRECIKNGS